MLKNGSSERSTGRFLERCNECSASFAVSTGKMSLPKEMPCLRFLIPTSCMLRTDTAPKVRIPPYSINNLRVMTFAPADNGSSNGRTKAKLRAHAYNA